MKKKRGIQGTEKSAGPSGSEQTHRASGRPRKRALLAAALALPGLGATAAKAAGNAPEVGHIGFKVLYYQDYQPSGKRMNVTAPSLQVAKTTLGDFVIEGNAIAESISGASPLYHSTLSGASGVGIRDRRRAGDLKLTKYFERFAIGGGIGYSKENDYRSRFGSIDLRFFSASKNTTVALGLAKADDTINSVNNIAINRARDTTEYLIGLTQVLTPNDIVQTNVTYADGTGYFSDPYKQGDSRPDSRRQIAWLTRWNHHFDSLNATLRSSYRYYRDSWKIAGHTVGTEWVQGAGDRWFVVPSLRYTTQSKASFYVDPPFTAINILTASSGGLTSSDQRLSAFGAIAPGIKLIKEFASGWAIDLKAEYYEQRGNWRLGGEGSPGLEPFKAQIYQLGVSTKF
jgi:hypothetical protein